MSSSPVITENRYTAELTRLSQRLDTLEALQAESAVTIHTLQAQKAELEGRLNAHCESAIQEAVGPLKIQLDEMKIKLSNIEGKVDQKIKSVNEILNDISVKPKTKPPAGESVTTSRQLEEVESKLKTLDEAIKKLQSEQNTVTQPPAEVNSDTTQPVFNTPRQPSSVQEDVRQPPPPSTSMPPSRNVPPTSSPRTYTASSSRTYATATVQNPSTRAPSRNQNQQHGSWKRPRRPLTQQFSPKVRMVGASNTGKIASALRNTIPNIDIRATPGATFDTLAGDIGNSRPCDIMIISGGVNEADTLEDIEMARYPLRDAINRAKQIANVVIVMPPPPLKRHNIKEKIQQISDMMAWEAWNAQVECVDVWSHFNDSRTTGQYLFDRRGLHINKLGGGIYAWTLLDHLRLYHSRVPVNQNFCVFCQHTGHKYDGCRNRLQNPPGQRTQQRSGNTHTSASSGLEYNVPISNRYYALESNYDEYDPFFDHTQFM